MARSVQAIIDEIGFLPHLDRLDGIHLVLAADQVFDGLDSGSGTNLAVDGTTPVKFKHTVEADHVHVIRRSNIIVLDPLQTPTKFGGIAAIANGIKVEILAADGTTPIFDYTSSGTIKKNSDWKRLSGVDNVRVDAAQDDSRGIRWTMARSGGLLVMLPGQVFQVTVQDNLAAIEEITWDLQGRRYSEDQFLKILGL